VRVTERTVERIEYLRGEMPRSEWLRQQIDESLLAAEELDGLF